MSDRPGSERQTSPPDVTSEGFRRVLNEPIPAPDDPGGAHAKGYSADPAPDQPVPEEGPVPLASGAEARGHVIPPKKGATPPTGRGEPKDYTPNDRLMGSDR